jgi:hypothetical protein
VDLTKKETIILAKIYTSMKRFLMIILLVFLAAHSWSQDYVAIGDSCFNVKNYSAAASNYDLFLQKVESRSNMIVYKSAKSWSLAGDSVRALAAVRKYVSNNYINEYYTFSGKLMNDKAFDLLKNKTEWKGIIAEVMEREQDYKKQQQVKLDSILNYQEKLEKQGVFSRLKLNNGSRRSIYENIKGYNHYPKIKDQLISFQFKFNDTLHSSFLVVLPKDYNEKRKYPLLFFLHGAVKMNTGYSDYSDERDTAGWNRFYTKYASIHQVIMVYPQGNREYNWMSPDKGFYMLPGILKQVKKIVNTDDDRVFISGHSNGATGSFSYAMKQPSPFAGFYGFNTRPQVATGGTYIRNLLNRSFFNVSTDQDYYYPPAAHDTLSHIMKSLGVDYQDHRYNGFPHWFPAFPESEPAFSLVFADLVKRKRNPFHSSIEWECDDPKYGRIDWIEITALDTVSPSAHWQRPLNFNINKWVVLDKDDQAILRDTALKAFTYTKQSGAIRANYKENTFTIETSKIKSFRLYISPKMVDLKKQIHVLVNGKELYKGVMGYNREILIKEFVSTIDRAAVWVNYIDVKL